MSDGSDCYNGSDWLDKIGQIYHSGPMCTLSQKNKTGQMVQIGKIVFMIKVDQVGYISQMTQIGKIVHMDQ